MALDFSTLLPKPLVKTCRYCKLRTDLMDTWLHNYLCDYVARKLYGNKDPWCVHCYLTNGYTMICMCGRKFKSKPI